MSVLTCLLCYQLLPKNTSDEDGESERSDGENDYNGPEIAIPILCKTLQLASTSFTIEEYSSFKAPLCSECDSRIDKIQNLLEDLKNIEENIVGLRNSIKTQLSESLQNTQSDQEDTNESEIIRLKIFTDLTKVSPVDVPQTAPVNVKEEPISDDSNYEDDSIPDFNYTFTNEDSSESNVVIKKEKGLRKDKRLSKDSRRKNLKNKHNKSKIKNKEKKSKGVKKETPRNVQTAGKTQSNVSRSGRLLRSTVKPDYLYVGKKSIYAEHGSSEDEDETGTPEKIKLETSSADIGDNGGYNSDDNLDAGMSNDSSERSDQSENDTNSSGDEAEAEERPKKIRKKESMKNSSKKEKKVSNAYKHIIDPDLTMDQIKLIGSNKKPLESNESHVTVSKNGKRSINMSKIITDESVAVVKIKERLYGKRFSCTHEGCGKTFTDKESRDVHFKKKHENNETPYECEKCNKSFRQKRTLLRHVELLCEDLDEPRKWPKRKRVQVRVKNKLCPYCPEMWRGPNELNIHIRKAHTGETPFKCQYCEQSFISRLRLEFHVERSHQEVTPLKCEYCGKGFFREHRLKNHLVVHTRERPFLCEICCRSFPLKNQLTFHQAIHDEQMAYKFRCDKCDKTFASTQILKLHIAAIHEKVYKYICEICNHGSAQSSGHRIHMRTHTGEKPYSCPHCDKSFICGSRLTIHLRTHTGERPFVCKLCQASFVTSSRLNRHELIHKRKELSLDLDPLADPTQTIDELGQPIEDLGQPILQLDQPIEDLGQPILQLDQPIEELGQPILQLDQPIQQLEQPIPDSAFEKFEIIII